MSERESWAAVDPVELLVGVTQDSVCRSIEAKSPPAHQGRRLWKFKLSEVDAGGRTGGDDALKATRMTGGGDDDA